MKHKIKILFDISHGIHGSTGIQQDMRRILSSLIKHSEFEVDFLVYDMLNNVPYNTFKIKENIDRYGEIVSQARLLSYYFNPKGERILGERIKGRIMRKLYKRSIIHNSTPETIVLDRKFNEILYKKLIHDDGNGGLFSYFLNSQIIMTNFSTEGSIVGMMKKDYQTPVIDTQDYDLAIFFQELPIKVSSKTIKIVRSYDLIQILGPDVVFKADYKSNYQYKSIKENIKQNAHFLTISNAVAKEIKEIFSKGAQTRTIPVAISDLFKPTKGQFNISSYAKMYLIRSHTQYKFNKNIPKSKFPYFLSVSTIEPRKNILSTYQALKKLKMQNGYDNLKLVLVGKIGWNLSDEYRNMFLDEDVIVLANVPTRDLPYLYSNTQALVYVPFKEGFGVPPAEAMASGCPVILSDIPVHREIHTEGKPSFVDHYNVDQIAEKMSYVLDSANKKDLEERKKAGLKHVKKYTIEATGKMWHNYILDLVNKS